VKPAKNMVFADDRPNTSIRHRFWLARVTCKTSGHRLSARCKEGSAGLTSAHLTEIIERDRVRALPPRFRIADVPGLCALQQALAQLGFTPVRTTRVEFGRPAALTALSVPCLAQRGVRPIPAGKRRSSPPAGTHTQRSKCVWPSCSAAETACSPSCVRESAYCPWARRTWASSS
jgi:hypothetical protein